jgi:gluconate 2-dehydrogenase alpha chain
MTQDEIRNDVEAWLAAPKARGEAPTWRDDTSGEAGRSPWPVTMMNGIGGATVHYPGLSARFHPWNFAPRSATIDRYGAGALPAGSTLADWPLSYDELEPYYQAVERSIGVAGASGASAFEGPRRGPYPMPPLRRSGWTDLTDGAARRLGWHPFPAPAAINSVPYNGNAACTYCGFCADNGCHVEAKGSTDATAIRRAEATGRLRIETGARVVRIETDAHGRATGATYVRDGRERTATARAVLLATFTYENTRLLLLSRSRAHPAGIGNAHDQVGRNYMAHVTPFALGRFPDRRLNHWNGSWVQATCVDDWNADNFDHTGRGFIAGGLMVASHELKPIAFARLPLPPGVPRFGTGWKAWLARTAQSVGTAGAQMECLPYPENRLDLDPVARDPYGVPRVRITFRPRENELRGAAFLGERLEQWLREAGADEVWHGPPTPIEARHCYGGARMGDDPATSVVDRDGFVHDAPNLGVLGTSVYPASGGHNPTLTLQALAWRTAERLAERIDRT